jgi:hypothetical protein
MKTYFFAVLFVVALVAPVWAQDADWGPWASLGNNVSVRISSKLMNGGVTWEFRNGGNVDITYMDYYYNDNAGKHEDWFPGTLRAGGIFGGWAAFGPSTGTPVSFQLKAVKLANASGGTSGNATGTSQSDTSSQQAALQQQIQQQQAAAWERQQQLQQQQAALQQQIAEKQAQLQAQRTAQETRRQQALDVYNAAVQRNQAMQNSIQNATDQIVALLQRQQAEKDEREAQEQMEREQAEAEREQRDLQSQIEQLQQQADNVNNNQNVQNNNNYVPPVNRVAPAAPPPKPPPATLGRPVFDNMASLLDGGSGKSPNAPSPAAPLDNLSDLLK